jgi:tetratricopeptide (TPR) repeat protein
VPWILVGGLFFAQYGRMLAGSQVLESMEMASVTPEERSFLERADYFIESGSYVIASPLINELVPAFTDAYVLYFKGNEPFFPETVQDIQDLFNTGQANEEFVETLIKYSMAQYLIANQESEPSLVKRLDQMPLIFSRVFQYEGYRLYASNLDRATEAGRSIMWGSYYHLIGDNERALQSLLPAIENDEELSESELALAYVGLGDVWLGLGVLEEAEQAYGEAIHLAPNLGQAHIGLGNAYWQQGRLEEAIHSFGRVSDADQHVTLARALGLQALGDKNQQAGDVDEAVKSYKESARAYYSLNDLAPEGNRDLCNSIELLRMKPTVTNGSFSVSMFFADNLPRVVLYQHPPSQIAYQIRIPHSSKLTFGIGLSQQVWQLGMGDGVQFDIQLDTGENLVNVFSEYIDPKNIPADRQWHYHELDLSSWAGQTVTITLATDPGPAGDLRYDWAGWEDPCIVQP